MFRKLLINLSYSPSSIEQLGDFAKKIKLERRLRESGLLFTIFSIVALAFTLFDPSQSNNVVNNNHIQQFLENISGILPHISTTENLLIAITILILSLLLYIRAGQLCAEIREVRREFNIGNISDESLRKVSHKHEFSHLMSSVRKKFPFMKRLNSKILHFRAIEIISEFLANVLLQPISLLLGGIFALIFTAAMYIFAKYYGFSLKGSEWAMAFITGWAIGLICGWLQKGFAKHPDTI